MEAGWRLQYCQAMHRGSVICVVFLALNGAKPAYSQLFSVGIKGGSPTLAGYQNGYWPGTASYQRRYIVGPTAEVHLPLHLSFEVDALYRRSGLSYTYVTAVGPFYPTFPAFGRDRVNDWQVPFLAKWAPGAGQIRPFVDGGVSYRHLSDQTTEQLFNSPSAPSFQSFSTGTHMVGGTFGAGLTFKLVLVRFSPEIRYTHWNSPSYVGDARANSNQVDFLLGLTF
jgi:hypothetical protein